MSILRIDIAATPEIVWEHLRDIESHTQWMLDARSVSITSEQREGVGTRVYCLTKVGPISVDDYMTVLVWTPGQEMTMQHVGYVTGTGTFRLMPFDNGRRTHFEWSEHLDYPWWMGGALGQIVGGVALRTIWRKNLVRLRDEIEHG